MNVTVIIGKNFGDEGKGLATEYFAEQSVKRGVPCLGIRHNGGAQAGHTVDRPNARFVFHQLSSGSFCGATTLWADTFLPDLFKLREELDAFYVLSGQRPSVTAFAQCRCVWIDDVLINMALEHSRGDNRHGSCGMGINEAVERSYDLSTVIRLGDVIGHSCEQTEARLRTVRREYTYKRLEALGLSLSSIGEYGDLLVNDAVIHNAAEEMCRGAEHVTLLSPNELKRYDGDVVIEGAQGLLLDEYYTAYAPHLTTSRTGSTNPSALCRQYFPHAAVQTVYVSRTYVTRHGQGPLPCEDASLAKRYGIRDVTNQPNEWQGALRYAPHESVQAFCRPIEEDQTQAVPGATTALLLTHTNETDGQILFQNGAMPITEFARQWHERMGARVFVSPSPFTKDIQACIL